MAHISEAAPLQISRFYTGWYSYRNPLIVPIRQMGRRIIELYDAIADGLNMECTNRLTLKRRPGYVLINADAPFGKVLYFYTFKPSSFPGQLYQIIDTNHDIEHFQPGVIGGSHVLFFKQTPPLTTFATVGAYGYMSQELFAQKWDSPGGAQGVTNWGIDMFSNGFSGPEHFPAFGTNLVQTQPNPNPWINTQSVVAIDGLLSQVQLTRPTGTAEAVTSQWLLSTGFLFNFSTIPHDLDIRGFMVTLYGVTVQGATENVGLHVRMVRNGQLYGTYRVVTLPPNQTTINIGRPNDLWDGSWTANDVNQTLFGVAIQAVNNSDTPTLFSIDAVSITTYVAGKPAVALVGGTLTSEIGYQYQYCYGNSHSGHISSPTIPSFFNPAGDIGPIAPHTQGVQVSLEGSPDPQVTDIHVYRTTDGGGEPFFELPTSPYPNQPNAIFNIVDNALDNTLQIASICPDQHFNDPPPGGAVDPCWYAGRLWLHRNHQLFFASGPDISQGNGQEAWYPVYTFAIPEGQIVRKFPTPNGLLLITNDNILIVRGLSTPSFSVTDFAKDLGIRAWTAADSDGTNIYMYTTDRQLLLLNPNGFTTISQVIADQIQVVDPSLAYVSQYRYTAQDNMMFVADGSTFIYPYNQELQAWNTRQQPTGGVDAIGRVEVTPGVFQMWRSRSIPPDNSLVSYRDTTGTVFSDELTPYPCHVIFGAIPVADLLTLAQIRDIALNNSPTSSRKKVSAIANEIFPIAGKQFEILEISSSEPPELSATPSLSYEANRYTWKSTPLSELVNHIFFKVDFSADPNPDELYVWTIGGSQTTGGSSLGAPGQLPQLQGR